MRSVWRRQEPLPYNMFDLAREAYEAKKADTMEGIYHRAQERAWSGKEVLPMLIAQHGPPRLPEREKEALARIFAIILWGELAAWKIAAQLAEAIEPLEAKMAATSQAFDEARHFYTMYDYLTALGYVPEHIDRRSEKVLELTLRAKSLPQKICGMQLMIETIALTIFQTVRQRDVEPVLSELLRYYEIDEARHVGLGINYMPSLIKNMSKAELVGLSFFQLKLMFWTIWSMKALEPDLKVLGIKTRDTVELGKAKQTEVFQEMWREFGLDVDHQRPMVARIMESVGELVFPKDDLQSMPKRFKYALERFFASNPDLDKRYVDEFQAQIKDNDTLLKGMGNRFKFKRRSSRQAPTAN